MFYNPEDNIRAFVKNIDGMIDASLVEIGKAEGITCRGNKARTNASN